MAKKIFWVGPLLKSLKYGLLRKYRWFGFEFDESLESEECRECKEIIDGLVWSVKRVMRV